MRSLGMTKLEVRHFINGADKTDNHNRFQHKNTNEAPFGASFALLSPLGGVCLIKRNRSIKKQYQSSNITIRPSPKGSPYCSAVITPLSTSWIYRIRT